MSQYGNMVPDILIEFSEFLKQKNVIIKYVDIINNQHNMSVQKFLTSRKIEPHDYIFEAFTWELTEDGDAFWSDIHSAWCEYLDNKENEVLYSSIW